MTTLDLRCITFNFKIYLSSRKGRFITFILNLFWNLVPTPIFHRTLSQSRSSPVNVSILWTLKISLLPLTFVCKKIDIPSANPLSLASSTCNFQMDVIMIYISRCRCYSEGSDRSSLFVHKSPYEKTVLANYLENNPW